MPLGRGANRVSSEDELESELQLAGIVGAGDLPEIAVIRAGIDAVELRMVPNVVVFGTELHVYILVNRDVLIQREVPVEQPGTNRRAG